MASPQRHAPADTDTPLATGQGPDDEFDGPDDDPTGVSLPPPAADPILPPPSNAI